MEISEETRTSKELFHYGILRKSGRYPWGSGGSETARSKSFLDHLSNLRKEGMSDADIAKGFGMTTSQLRQTNTIAKNAIKQADINRAVQLKDKGYSNVAIGKMMADASGKPRNESSVRSLLAAAEKDERDILTNTADMLRRHVEQKGYLDVGTGVENWVGISQTKLNTAVAMLKDQHGYVVHTIQVDQPGTGFKTNVKVLALPGKTYGDVKAAAKANQIGTIREWSEDGGRTLLGIKPPLSLSSKRVGIRFAEDGGDQADGVIFVRPGMDDLSLGGSRYAQVRVAVDGSHYLKGMAMYKNDLPDGVDVVFNTNKPKGTPVMGSKDSSVLKLLKDDPDNPFGSAIARQLLDEKGNARSVMNIVNEEGDWEKWSKNIASQVLSKQSPKLAEAQLSSRFLEKKAELDEIKSLTNPAVRRVLLEKYADGADALSVNLKAAHLPGQGSHVILPIKSLKDTEIYAPNFNAGDRVVLIRYPHGGKFEIPELMVNNSNPEAKRLLGTNPRDAVGINHEVAKRLSGADFDGDTVLVIPNNSGRIKTQSALQGLKDFDAQRRYPGYEGMTKMDAQTKGREMGRISNLITDMTIKGAGADDLAAAVRHSMVVIDAEKHGLDWKASARDNNIPSLMKKYQGKSQGGAATLISRASARQDVRARKLNYRVDPKTGKKVWIEQPGFEKDGKTVYRTQQSKKLAETDDAFTLTSKPGTKIESVYAEHSNRMKDLANQARLASINTRAIPYSPSARKHYAEEVASLDAKLNVALRNRPLERQALLLANTTIAAKKAANPDMDKAEEKKIKGLALTEARLRTGAKKTPIEITDREWQAIQAGAITHNRLMDILNNTDHERVKELATPRSVKLMTSVKQQRAQALLASGHTQAEVASALGVSLTTLKNSLKGDG